MTTPASHSPFNITEIELTYRNPVKSKDRPQVTSSQNTYSLLLDIWEQNKLELVEQCNLLLLDNRNALLGLLRLSTGGIGNAIADPRIMFAAALKARATGMILGHNHPSGNLQPSQTDRELTDKLYHGGRLLDIKLLDHLIVTPDGFFSFADDGLLPSGTGSVPMLMR